MSDIFQNETLITVDGKPTQLFRVKWGSILKRLGIQEDTASPRLDILFNSVASGVAQLVSEVPPNAIVTSVDVAITEAFNAGTTNVLIVGTVADDDALVTALNVDETVVAVTRVLPATLGGKLSATVATEVFAKYTQTGTAATTGAATVIVNYVEAAE